MTDDPADAVPAFLDFAAQVDARGFDVAFRLGAGERLAVLGPNGAGKSTLLSVLAGTLRPDRGRATLDGRLLFDLPGSGSWLPPHRRRIALLAQDPLLFPNLTALDNVAFGPRAARQPRTQARRIAQRWLDEVAAGDLAARRPGQLSGGQAQRVAVARAVAADPRLLLLDEPLAALDVTAAPMLRRVLRTVVGDRAVVVVTHDLLDAVLLTDRVLVLERGRVVESGPTLEVLRHPTSSFTARLAGLNLVRGVAVDDSGGEPGGIATVRPTGGGLLVSGIPRGRISLGEPVLAVFPPASVSVHLEAPYGSPRNQLRVVITELEPQGDQVAVRATPTVGGGTDPVTALVTAAALSELDLYPGRVVWYSIKATAVTVYPR